jgi:quercetin dioxygenase-like cupin family protein
MTAPSALRPGVLPTRSWGHNPVTGELAHVLVDDVATGGRRIEVELFLQPGAAVAGAHRHPTLVERFEVREGRVGFLVGDARHELVAGDAVAEVPAGVVHDWWNAGDGVARVRVEVEAAPGTEPLAGRFVAMIETLWSLGALGRTNAKGMPDPLWLAAIAHEYRDVIRFVSPPAAVQTTLFGALARAAHLLRRNPSSPDLHGPGAPIWIEDPGPNLQALLSPEVEARTARSR